MSGASVSEIKAAYAAQLSGLAVENWDELRAALAEVEVSDSFGQWRPAVKRADGTSRMAFPALSAPAEALIRAFTRCGVQTLFEGTSWPRGKALAADPGSLAKATPAEAAMVIAAQLRLDRFVDGHLLTCFDSGLMQKAVRRMLDAAPLAA
ncbi:DUF6508 domain-containing protein [Propionicimonas sp.]|uniref:DUF6508 domain-containing protein n=1 Tax=Propionicimonas sp. TaxID=1955623 RepID=UPI0017C16FD8|nr:DUF6508 domain-containing protein [Propionicimonas sp.]MBU3976123.1 hypothetical protein [Actinomycetota bacterium]MBA3020935.1 hypothetical protein [Propionicimonas sp.]MBU3985313.1 hypothetical protein [Actinomycetota bacterium]MBU4008303.1 hypothetical protein [Actinomycetota bacterium]MBU4064483.1 hypothetical protein [Actinomycetota bacterium]